MRLAWRNPEVTMRHHSPWATPMSSPGDRVERRGDQPAVDDHLVARLEPGTDAGDEDGQVDRHQHLGDDRAQQLGRANDPLGAPMGALGTVEADRGLVHAIGADGPVAALADHAGPAVRVPVAGLHRRFHGGRLPVPGAGSGPDRTGGARARRPGAPRARCVRRPPAKARTRTPSSLVGASHACGWNGQPPVKRSPRPCRAGTASSWPGIGFERPARRGLSRGRGRAGPGRARPVGRRR